jgi:hypothetical protein
MAALLGAGFTAELWGPRVVFLALGCIALAAPFLAVGPSWRRAGAGARAPGGMARHRGRRRPACGRLPFPLLPAPIIYASAATLFAAASLGLVRPAACQS